MMDPYLIEDRPIGYLSTSISVEADEASLRQGSSVEDSRQDHVSFMIIICDEAKMQK
jgi:hypothetical protein